MLSLVEFSGSPFSVGTALGKFGAPAAHDYLIRSESWDSVMAWRGSQAAAAMLALVDAHFPQVRQELEGLASGLELPFEDVFLWNCRGDLWSMAPDGCTTVQLPRQGQPRITHNEDGDPGFAGHCGLGLFTPDNGPAFASFLYPASIPGHTFAVTAHGLVMTVNNLRSRQVTTGVPRMVLTRAILNQTRLENALTLLRSTPKAGGFHLSLAQSGQPELYTVEFNALGVSAFTLTEPALHANHLIHPFMRDHAQLITDSSRCRQERGDALLAQGVHDPLRILADQENRVHPVYRNAPNDSDKENTMATADLHVGAGQVDWCVYAHPGEPPQYRLADARLV